MLSTDAMLPADQRFDDQRLDDHRLDDHRLDDHRFDDQRLDVKRMFPPIKTCAASRSGVPTGRCQPISGQVTGGCLSN